MCPKGTMKKTEQTENDLVATTNRLDKASTLVRDYAVGAVGVGLIPLPIFDVIGLSAMQFRMLNQIAQQYDIEFSKKRVKSLIAPLMGGMFPIVVTISFTKIIPGIGTTTGMLSTAAIAGPSTYAIGKIFIRHFESGGTFLDFDPEKFKKHFADEMKEARKLLAQSKANSRDEQGDQCCNHSPSHSAEEAEHHDKHSSHALSHHHHDENSCCHSHSKERLDDPCCNHSHSHSAEEAEHHDKHSSHALSQHHHDENSCHSHSKELLDDQCCSHEHSHSAETTELYKRNLKLGTATLAWIGAQKLFFPSIIGINSVVFILAGLVTVITGFGYLRGLWNSIVQRNMNTDTLIGTAILATLALGQGVTALSVIFLLNIGQYLEARTLQSNEKAIRSLLSANDEEVWIVVKIEQAEVEISRHLDEICLHDTVVVYAGKRIAVDGTITQGQGQLNEAPITGESIPVFKNVGDKVYAGTILLSGKLWIETEKIGNDTVAGLIIQRVTKAKELKPPIQTVGEKFSTYVIPASLGTAGLVFLITLDPSRALSMLLIACPCAIGLSTPTAINAAIGNAAKKGVMIKGGTHLETTAKSDVIIFDKTGTLTSGEFEITHIVSFSEEYTLERIISLAVTAERHSEHPLALALINHANNNGITIPSHGSTCKTFGGRGILTTWEQNSVLIGNSRLMEDSNIFLPQKAVACYNEYAQQGESVMYVVHQGNLIGLISMRNNIKDDVIETLTELRSLELYRLLMLTGDNTEAAKLTAEMVSIDEWYAQLLPEQKYQLVRELQSKGHKVIMVGDGINDAPALAVADVGISMGTSRADVTVESADIVIAGDDFHHLKTVIQLSKKTLSVIRQNYALALGVNVGGMGFAIIGLLNPFMAAILHNASTVAVVINSARLINYEPNNASKLPLNSKAASSQPLIDCNTVEKQASNDVINSK